MNGERGRPSKDERMLRKIDQKLEHLHMLVHYLVEVAANDPADAENAKRIREGASKLKASSDALEDAVKTAGDQVK